MEYKVIVIEVDDGVVNGAGKLQECLDGNCVLVRADSTRDFVVYILKCKR